MRTLSIVIPCFNEEATIRTILSRVLSVKAVDWKMEVIIIDDGSTDATRIFLKEFEGRVKVIYQPSNQGKGSAVHAGLAAATGDFVLIQDADLEYSPEEIPELLGAVKGENSIVYGSRNITRIARKGFLISRFGVWVMTELVNLLYGSTLTDICTCYKLFPVKYKDLFSVGKFESEVVFTLELLRKGLHIVEVPISHMPRDVSHGKKIRYRDGLYALALICKDWLAHLPQTLFNKKFFWCMVAVGAIIIASLLILKPVLDPMGDGPSYVTAMKVLQTGTIPPSFIPNRILTTFGGLESVIALSMIFGNLLFSWMSLNILLFLIACGAFYKILLRLFQSEKVAILGTLFLAGNYAMISFGLNYFMDVGGWAFYLLSHYYLLKHIESGRNSYLWRSAIAIGIGGMFKEYAFLACISIAVVLITFHYRFLGTLIKKAIPAAFFALAPTILVYIFVYLKFHYSYVDWLAFANAYYEYNSKIVEFIKSIGSLINILGLLFLGGLYYLIRQGKSLVDGRYHIFILSLFISILPIFFWPAITQRVLFIIVPFMIVVAGVVFKKYERLSYIWGIVLALYIVLSFSTGVLLNAVNLPF